MPWVRTDDSFDIDPDLAYLSNDAVCFHLCARTWSARNLTDGLIPFRCAPAIKGYSPEVIEELLTQCAPMNDPWLVKVEEGYVIRSFLKYNPSGESVKATRKARSEAGAKGAETTNSAKSQQTSGKPSGKTSANDQQTGRPVPVPVPDPIPEPSGKKAITLGDSKVVPLAARDAFFASVLDHLESATGKQIVVNFDKSPRLQNLRARWKECPVSEREYFLSACKLVIDHKTAMWGNDPKMREYIRPETLFSTKFEGYYAEAQEWDANGRRNAKGEQSWEDTLQVMIGGLK